MAVKVATRVHYFERLFAPRCMVPSLLAVVAFAVATPPGLKVFEQPLHSPKTPRACWPELWLLLLLSLTRLHEQHW